MIKGVLLYTNLGIRFLNTEEESAFHDCSAEDIYDYCNKDTFKYKEKMADLITVSSEVAPKLKDNTEWYLSKNNFKDAIIRTYND